MNPASGPDCLRMAEYNAPAPAAFDLTQWRREKEREIEALLRPTWPDVSIIAKKVLRRIEAVDESIVPGALHTCDICAARHIRAAPSYLMQRHHIIPVSEHPYRTEPSRVLNRRVWLCRRCHVTTHKRFSNMCLAEMPWEAVREVVRAIVITPKAVATKST